MSDRRHRRPDKLTKDMSVDAMLGAFWDICAEDWVFELAVDQWWFFGARCPHHPYQGQLDGMPTSAWTWWAHSHGPIDLSTAVIDVYAQALEVHEASNQAQHKETR